MVTRPEAQAEEFCSQLRAAGACPIRFPTIQLAPIPDTRPLQRALEQLESFRWVIFTSVNGVVYTWRTLNRVWPQELKVAAIGPATAAALHARTVAVDFMPKEFRAERIATGLRMLDGGHVLLLRAERARPILADMLRARRVHVTEIAVYRTLTNRPPAAAYAALQKGVDAITFTSTSTVEGFTTVAEHPSRDTLVACIGPVTAQAARDHGYNVRAIAREYTTGGLLKALQEHFENP